MSAVEVANQRFTFILLCMMGVVALAYLLFVIGSWFTIRENAAKSDAKMDQFLARIPKPAE